MRSFTDNNLAVIKLNGKFGYIDMTGSEVIPLKFEKAENFNNGKAKVMLDGREIFIDQTGKELN